MHLHDGPVEGDVRHDPVGELQHGYVVGELLQHVHAGGERNHVAGIDDSGEGVKGFERSVENSEDGREKTNLYGMNYLFEFVIEGKDSMDPSEEDWDGKIRISRGSVCVGRRFRYRHP